MSILAKAKELYNSKKVKELKGAIAKKFKKSTNAEKYLAKAKDASAKAYQKAEAFAKSTYTKAKDKYRDKAEKKSLSDKLDTIIALLEKSIK